MQKLIDTSTAFYGAGNAPTSKLFKIKSGSYSGRLLALYSESASTIKFSFADPPYTSWSTPVTIASDAADYPVSGWLDDDGNVNVAYTKTGTLQLVFRLLTFVSGEWSVGSEVVIYNDKANYFPSLVRQSSGRLNLCWTSYDATSGEYSIRFKTSENDGQNWGGGPGDSGSALVTSSSGCYCELLYLNERLHCIYTTDGTTLAHRDKDVGAALFNNAVTLYSGSGLSDSLSCAVSESGALVGVAFEADGKLWFVEYDTSNWSSPFEIATSPATPPKLLFNGAIPYVIYGLAVGTDQVEVYYRYKQGTGFAAAAILHRELARFECVMLYDADDMQPWVNRTSEAGDNTAADVFQPNSGKLLQAVGDAVYLGSSEKFAAVSLNLSTAGDALGRVSWSYFNGAQWVEFTPLSGEYYLNQNSQLVRLWADNASAPSNWQKIAVDDKSYFWIRIEVTTAFSTAPVGTQITPLTDLHYLTS